MCRGKEICHICWVRAGTHASQSRTASLTLSAESLKVGTAKGGRDGVGQTILEAWGGAAVFLLVKYYV